MLRNCKQMLLGMALAVICGNLAIAEETKEAKKDESQKSAEWIFQHDEILDLKVLDETGHELGTIKDLVIVMPEGRVRYAALEGEKLAGEGQLVAVPWAALQVKMKKTEGQQQQEQQSPQQGEKFAQLQVEPQMLAQAAFPDDQPWPAKVNEQVMAQIEEKLGRERVEVGFRGTEGAEGAKAVPTRLTKIEGVSVKTTNGEDIADLEEIFVDSKEGRVAFITIGTGGFLGLGETTYALPPEMLELTRPGGDEEHYFTLNMTADQLKQAPVAEDDLAPGMLVERVSQFRKKHMEKKEQ